MDVVKKIGIGIGSFLFYAFYVVVFMTTFVWQDDRVEVTHFDYVYLLVGGCLFVLIAMIQLGKYNGTRQLNRLLLVFACLYAMICFLISIGYIGFIEFFLAMVFQAFIPLYYAVILTREALSQKNI